MSPHIATNGLGKMHDYVILVFIFTKCFLVKAHLFLVHDTYPNRGKVIIQQSHIITFINCPAAYRHIDTGGHFGIHIE